MSPSVWSKENGIPILCMFTEDIVKAQKVFDAINRTSNLPNENDIDDAIEFLKSNKMDILERVHIKRASKIIANMMTERKMESSLS